MAARDSAAELERMIERYNDAWNAQDLDAILALWPDLSFAGRRLYARDGLVVSEWTATATAPDGRRLTWDGVDLFPCEDGRIRRKDVYSAAHRARTLDG